MPKYKDKKELESGNVSYQYGKQAIKERNQKKLNQCRVVEDNIEAIIEKVAKEIKRGTEEALAIGIMLCTFERIGNDDSASDGHYGITNLEGRHFTDHKTWIELNYIGKSGVEQHKEIHDPIIVNAIRLKLARTPKNSRLLNCTPVACNEFLRPFSCTSKDIRTFAANRLMADDLAKSKKIYGNGYKANKIRNQIFNRAAKRVAEDIGHKPNTLKGMYLNSILTNSYLKKGVIRENPAPQTKMTAENNLFAEILRIGVNVEQIDSELHVWPSKNKKMIIKKSGGKYLAKLPDGRNAVFSNLEDLINIIKASK